MFAENVTTEEINDLPLYQFSGGIFIIDTFEKLDFYLPLIKDQKILGFDTETKPSFKKGKNNPVSLLQLTSKTQAFLIRINKIGLPPEISDILIDNNIKKIGLAIKDDIKILKNIAGFEPTSFIDLQDYVSDFGIEAMSLKKITAIVLNKRISKSQQVTNWDREELSEAQQIYAATDAWACLQVYNKLNQEK
ncbi:MAG: 3'-5' exonuclease domain-containing protein 2 [Bacteroidales bacterium]|jgi:ribonuclease D|nr:3'-5' exonuclease domain-containing protein 2 [Bacteroidales bacterium]